MDQLEQTVLNTETSVSKLVDAVTDFIQVQKQQQHQMSESSNEYLEALKTWCRSVEAKAKQATESIISYLEGAEDNLDKFVEEVLAGRESDSLQMHKDAELYQQAQDALDGLKTTIPEAQTQQGLLPELFDVSLPREHGWPTL